MSCFPIHWKHFKPIFRNSNFMVAASTIGEFIFILLKPMQNLPINNSLGKTTPNYFQDVISYLTMSSSSLEENIFNYNFHSENWQTDGRRFSAETSLTATTSWMKFFYYFFECHLSTMIWRRFLCCLLESDKVMFSGWYKRKLNEDFSRVGVLH